jgi:hypothetical protein
VKKAPIVALDFLMQERLQLINLYPKQGGEEGASLVDPNGTLDESWHHMGCAKMTKDWLVQVHDNGR